MTNDSTLTRLEKKITEDWHHEFPTLSVYKSRWLLRRAGPLLAGIVLDRTSGGDIYRPCFHLHCLCRAFPVVSLTLRTQLRTERNGSPTSVKVRMHEQTYRSAAELLKKQIPDLIEGDIAFDAVLRSYSDYLASPSGRGVAANLYADMIGLCVWAREIDKAASLLTDALSLPRDTAYRPYDGLAGFEALCRQMIDSPSFVDETVEQQIVFHKVQALPVSRLIAPNRAA